MTPTSFGLHIALPGLLVSNVQIEQVHFLLDQPSCVSAKLAAKLVILMHCTVLYLENVVTNITSLLLLLCSGGCGRHAAGVGQLHGLQRGRL